MALKKGFTSPSPPSGVDQSFLACQLWHFFSQRGAAQQVWWLAPFSRIRSVSWSCVRCGAFLLVRSPAIKFTSNVFKQPKKAGVQNPATRGLIWTTSPKKQIHLPFLGAFKSFFKLSETVLSEHSTYSVSCLPAFVKPPTPTRFRRAADCTDTYN